jgi:KDO2-lipid IV(A) lauroyltransferase
MAVVVSGGEPVSPLLLVWQRTVARVMTAASGRVRRLSPNGAARLGAALGDLGYLLAGRAKNRARANLRLALPDELATGGDRERVVRGVFRHFGRAVVGFVRAPALSDGELARLVTCEGWEHAEEALAQGRGLLLVTGHVGEWEVLGRWLARVQKLPLTVVAKDPKSPALAAYLRSMREGGGFSVRSKGDSPLPLIKALRRGEAICLLPDQNSGDVFVPFFGVPAGTVAGPASLALRTGAPLVPIYCLAGGNGGWQVVCLPPVDARPTGDHAADVERIMAELNGALESVVRAHPAQWLWLHNRWKSAFEEGNRERAWGDGGEQARRAAIGRWQG